MIWWITGFSILGSIGSVLGAGLLLLFPKRLRDAALPWLLSYATGTLLGAAFLALVPEALARTTPSQVSFILLAGILAFFLLEKFMLWRHCHTPACAGRASAGPLVLVGDGFHNFADGVVIAAAFLSSIPLGVSAALAIIAHEISQEMGDFAILLNSGYGRARALFLNTLSASMTLAGALLATFWLAQAMAAVPYVLAISAASFIYIAMADLVPLLHRQAAPFAALAQFAMILGGIGTILLLS